MSLLMNLLHPYWIKVSVSLKTKLLTPKTMQNRSIQSLSRCDQWDLMGELALSAGVICNALFTQTYSGFLSLKAPDQCTVGLHWVFLLLCVLTSLVACVNGQSYHKWDKNPGAPYEFQLLKFWFLYFQCILLDTTVCDLNVISLKICTVNNNQGLLKGSSCNIPWLIYILIHYPYLYLLISLPHQSLSFPSSLSLWALNLTAQYRNRSRLSFNIECVRQCSAQRFLL